MRQERWHMLFLVTRDLRDSLHAGTLEPALGCQQTIGLRRGFYVTDAESQPHPAPNGVRPRVGEVAIKLSTRQREVLELIGDGYTELEIARRPGISPRTVRMHSDALRMKLGVTRRRQLPLAYRRLSSPGLES
jgi:DNA-binding NarL/FixJ family response regulator